MSTAPQAQPQPDVAQEAPSQETAAPVATTKSFKMCSCGGPHPHGHFFKGGRKLKALVLGKRGGRHLLEILLEAELITAEERGPLEAQVEASNLPDSFEEDGITDIEAAEMSFATAIASQAQQQADPLEELLAGLPESLRGSVQVIRF
ncbi:MAG: hypothetical protein KBD16_03890 [Candidatus Pacebacteria bacterium]|nr:hypothetical protein [Candidatus Paceibacterota bacterium]